MNLFRWVTYLILTFFFKEDWLTLKEGLKKIYTKYNQMQPQIPPIIMQALTAAEDHRFYKHCGVDLIAIIRAVWCIVIRRKLVGGSTIEQQLVRTLTGQYERRLRRKTKEILFASQVYQVIPKSDILGTYLSIAYFGWRMNGIQQACKRLNIELSDATIKQATLLVARLKYPEPMVSTPERTAKIELRAEYISRLIMKHESILNQKNGSVIENATISHFQSKHSAH